VDTLTALFLAYCLITAASFLYQALAIMPLPSDRLRLFMTAALIGYVAGSMLGMVFIAIGYEHTGIPAFWNGIAVHFVFSAGMSWTIRRMAVSHAK